jgi:hypothetical protein
MFPLGVTNILKNIKIDIMGIWMIYLSVTLIPLKYFCSMSNGIGYKYMNVTRK